ANPPMGELCHYTAIPDEQKDAFPWTNDPLLEEDRVYLGWKSGKSLLEVVSVVSVEDGGFDPTGCITGNRPCGLHDERETKPAEVGRVLRAYEDDLIRHCDRGFRGDRQYELLVADPFECK